MSRQILNDLKEIAERHDAFVYVTLTDKNGVVYSDCRYDAAESVIDDKSKEYHLNAAKIVFPRKIEIETEETEKEFEDG